MTITTARHLTYLRRDGRFKAPQVQPGTVLPPRDLFKGHPDLLAAYDAFVHLSEAWVDLKATGDRARAEAPQAGKTYRAELATALAAGKPGASITNREPELLATADAHDTLAADAKAAAVAQGHVLGKLISTTAPDLFAACEARMDDAALEVRGAVEGLRKAWSGWSSAWHLRTVLSGAHLYGGALAGYRATTPLPAEVTAALDTLTDHLHNLDRLRADEVAVAEWREKEARAEAANNSLPMPQRIR